MSSEHTVLIQKQPKPEESNGGIHGLVVDPEGVAFPGVGVTITHQATQTEYSRRTDRNGNYDFTNLPSGSYDVLLQAPPTPTPFKRSKIISAEVVAGKITNLNSRMQISDFISPPEGAVMIGPPLSSGDISGVVLDDLGARTAGIEVTLIFASPSSLERKSKTDSDGAYRFIDLAPGKYGVHLKGKTFCERTVLVKVVVGKTTKLKTRLKAAQSHADSLGSVPACPRSPPIAGASAGWVLEIKGQPHDIVNP